MKRIAINGFGRIGRLTLRNLLQVDDVEVVAINDLTDTHTLAHLFEFDSAQGRFHGDVSYTDDTLIINGKSIQCLAIKSPSELPWANMEIDCVLECTGLFRTMEKASQHLEAGAQRVILSAPAKSAGIPTIVLGVNGHIVEDNDLVLSNASCTTNCLAPTMKVFEENFGVKHGFMCTIHSYTSNQNLQDGPHSDLRRARAAAQNIIPTTTGVTSALELVLPSVKGKILATSYRVPIITGSLIELILTPEKQINAIDVNDAFEKAASGSLKGIMEYNDKALVSSDIVSNTHSCIFDAPLTEMHRGMVKVTAWYDNESGYAARLADMAVKF